jgi:hypothetical protein
MIGSFDEIIRGILDQGENDRLLRRDNSWNISKCGFNKIHHTLSAKDNVSLGLEQAYKSNRKMP